MLRITDGMMVNNTRRHLNANLLRMDEYERQISSGKTISRPSDNPAGTVKSLRLRTSLMEGEQYLDNINEALCFMQTTDGTLNDIDELIQTIREKTVKAATTNSPDAFSAIAKEIKELQAQLKLIANATYGSKYIFAGTNVTEVPYENGKWSGNEDWLSVEIGVGVKTDINIPQMKSFFMGRMDYSINLNRDTGISSISAQNLKEGEYELRTRVDDAGGAFADSNIRESQSYLSAVPNYKHFFYTDIQHQASLGVGTDTELTDASYSGSLAINVTKVNEAPHLFLRNESTDTMLSFDIDKPLYIKNAQGGLIPIGNNTDLSGLTDNPPNPTNSLVAAGAGAITSAIYTNDGQGNIRITVNLNPPAADTDTVVWDNAGAFGKLYDEAGNEYIAADPATPGSAGTATYDAGAGKWNYHGTSYVTAEVKGYIYSRDFNPAHNPKEIYLKNVKLNLEAGAAGVAGDSAEIFRIAAHDIDPDGTMGFTDDLVVWNNSAAALGGIDMRNPQIAAGDKTILTFGASVAAVGAEQVKLDYSFKDIDGKQVGNGGFNYVFDPLALDNQTKDIHFFTMDQKTGVIQDAAMTFKTNTLGSSPVPPDTDPPAAKFEYTAGLFGYIEELAGTIQAGKLPEVGNMLKGTDARLQELLYHRSTIGARINRLELQESRLKNSEVTLTDLLSKNEDTDEAKVIMELKMQENVYQASLAVGARIIQPTLIDYLR